MGIIITEKIILHENEVHIWKVNLEDNISDIEYFRSILSDDEIKRADRFYFEKDRNNFTIARGLLRIILSEYIKLKPEKIIFSYNEFGKPGIEENLNGQKITFNISHSKNLALYAVSQKRNIGVDIEFMREKVLFREIAERFFSDNEIKELFSLPEEIHKEAFFNGWSRKEAYIKAKGKGLAIPLSEFDVSLSPVKPAKLLETRDEKQSWYDYTLYELKVDNGYKAALVAMGKDLELKFYEMQALKEN